MNPLDRRQAISDALKAFTTAPLREAGLNLFKAMGYQSEKTLELKPNSAETFLAQFDPEQKLDRKKALIESWKSVDFLFQLTDEEIKGRGQEMLDLGCAWGIFMLMQSARKA